MLAQLWGPGDIGFTSAEVAAAKVVAARMGTPEVVVATGNRALGLGRVGSSVELCVIGDLVPGTERVVDVAGTRVEVSAISARHAEQLLALTTEYRASGRHSPQLAIGAEPLRELIGLVTGWRLVTSPCWRARFDAVDPNVVRQMVISRAALGFAAAAADTFAALLSGDLFTAVSLSADALLFGCEAVLAAAGDLDTDARFAFRRLAGTAVTAAWCGRLWQLCHNVFPAGAEPGPALVREVVEERLLVGNLLLSWCAVEGWAKPLTCLPEPAGALVATGGAGPRRSAYFAPVRFARCWTLVGPTETYQTTEAVVRLWRRLVGLRPDDAVHELAGSEPELAGMPITDVEAAVTALHRIGAVEAPLPRPGRWGARAGTTALSIVPTTRFR